MLKRSRKPMLLLLAALSLSGCGQTRGAEIVRTVSDGCLWFGPITYSKDDTLETVGQIQRHNGRFDAVCGVSQ